MIKLVLVACFAVALLAFSSARKFTKCQLVRELRKRGFPQSKMRDWVCLIEHESGGDSKIIGPPNTDGSRDYGLFQINDRYWCSNTKKPGKECHVTCSDVKRNDIRKAAKCAKKIYKKHKFQAWYGWVNHCQSPASLPDISSC